MRIQFFSLILVIATGLFPSAVGFGGIGDSLNVIENIHGALHPAFHQSMMVSASDPVPLASNVIDSYQKALSENPLQTKMLTGGTLAVMGDALAQLSSKDQVRYDKRRAFSFMLFDMAYRATQHVAFPLIVQTCQGQYMGGFFHMIKPVSEVLSQHPESTTFFAAMEQTLASQLGIVPFLYYPVFYTLTAFVQGLDTEGAIQRAKETFIPLMKRNLLFWIPVQFVQFGFIDENLQIPFLSFCGLAWTVIISLYAGAAKSYTDTEIEDPALKMVADEPLKLEIEKAVMHTIEEEESSKERFLSLR